MFSIDKYQDSVAGVMAAFNLGKPACVWPLGGTATPKFAVEVPNGRFVVRVRPCEFAQEPTIRFDHEMLWRLAQAGLPVPCPQKRLDQTSWFHLGEHVVEVLSYVEGQPFEENDYDAIGNVGQFLARFHTTLNDDIPHGKDGFIREDHPDLLVEYVTQLGRLCNTKTQTAQIRQIDQQLDIVRDKLDSGLYARLPRAVVHGDIHPGNLQFRDSRVSAVYDFDYLSLQARTRDVCDAVMFFASRRNSIIDPDDIHSLTQPFEPDFERTLILLKGYQDIVKLTEIEIQTLPLLIRSVWIQIRLRGSRKVRQGEKVSFVLDGFFEPIDWLDHHAEVFFEQLRVRLAAKSD